MKNREDVLIIKNYHQKIFGIVYYAKCKKSDKVIIFCNPFAEEEKEVHLHLSNFARSLSDSGINVIRFHYRGTGDSFGRFEDYTLKTRISDIKKVISYAKTHFSHAKIGLFGIRLGATLATLVANDNNIIEYLLLWEPIVRGKDIFNELYTFRYQEEGLSEHKIIERIRRNFRKLQESGYMDLYGYKVKQELVKEIQRIDLLNLGKRYKNNLLIIQNSNDAVSQFNNSFRDICKSQEFLKVKTQPYWLHFRYKLPSKLFRVTIDWLLRN